MQTQQVSKLLKRNNIVGIKCTIDKPMVINSTLDNPYPLTVTGLVRYMYWLQDKRNLRPIGDFHAHIKLCSDLAKEIPLQEIEKRMKWANSVAKHAWGINFLKVKPQGKLF
jgi:hypothetical protein